jgi:hypothetical protein
VGSNLREAVATLAGAVRPVASPRFRVEIRDLTAELQPAGGGVEGISRDGHRLRAIFIASRNALIDDPLTPLVEAVK